MESPLKEEQKKKIQDEFDALLDDLSKKISRNYPIIYRALRTQYQLSELESIRYEICICLCFEANQAAITLTNHLIEKHLKTLLISHNKATGPMNLEEMEKHYASLVENYSSKDFSVTINTCKNKGLLTKHQAKDLHEIREKIRNPFSHADMKGLFGDSKMPMVMGSFLEPNKLEKKEVSISNIPFVQGEAQRKLADSLALRYFMFIDKLIRETTSKIQ